MSVCSKKEKWSEVSLCDEVNASAPCSVEFTLKACFPDDKQQTYLAKGIPFRATNTPQGTIEGVLDSNGSVVIPDVGIGNVTIEVLPNLEKELQDSREKIKAVLSELIAQERAEAKAIQANYNNANWLEKRGYDIKAAASGVGSFFEGVWGAIKGIGSAISAVKEELGEYIRHPMNIPETFKEDVAAIKAKYKALEKFANEDLENYFLLMSDDKTQDIFTTFAGDYYDAQHYSEVIEGGSEAVTGIILTIITAGAGAAVAGGATASRLAMTASKLKAPIDKIIKALQQKTWFKKSKPVERQSVQANEKAVAVNVLQHNIKCFKPGKDLKASAKDPKKLEKEFYRQLKDQEAGINKMSVSEYLKNRQRLKDLTAEHGREKARRILTQSSKAQNAARKKLDREIRDSVKVSLEKKGIVGKKAQAIIDQKAKEQLGQLAALHDPDLIAGGSDKIARVGDKGVNSSIGPQWAKGGRVEAMDKAAKERLKTHGPDAKMDIKLERCK